MTIGRIIKFNDPQTMEVYTAIVELCRFCMPVGTCYLLQAYVYRINNIQHTHTKNKYGEILHSVWCTITIKNDIINLEVQIQDKNITYIQYRNYW